MNHIEWSRARSDFNHSWLKNRLIVALYRAGNICSGQVTDPGGLRTCKELLSEWPERRTEAWNLVHAYKDVMALLEIMDSPSEVSFLDAVTALRWKDAEDPFLKVDEVAAALKEFDKVVEQCEKLDSQSINLIQQKARKLTDAFSQLSPCPELMT